MATKWYHEEAEDVLFDTEDDARETVCDVMEFEDWFAYIQEYITYEQLLEFAMSTNSFEYKFDQEVLKAENDYFNDHYHKTEVEG